MTTDVPAPAVVDFAKRASGGGVELPVPLITAGAP